MPSLTYLERRPARTLAPFVECLWIVRDSRQRFNRAPNRILPDGCPEWIIHAADPFERCIGERWYVQPRSFLAGTLTRPWLIRSGVRVRTLGIRFKPGAASLLLDIDLADTADREVDLDKLLNAKADSLTQSVCRAGTTSRMLDVAEAALLGIAAPRLHGIPKTREAVKHVLKCQGSLRIDALAAFLAISRRTLERRFATELGITPKQFASIVRFNAVLASVADRERTQLVDLALAGGYFDEAHLLRDVRRLAGRSLRHDTRIDGDLAYHFTRPERLRVLLDRAADSD